MDVTYQEPCEILIRRKLWTRISCSALAANKVLTVSDQKWEWVAPENSVSPPQLQLGSIYPWGKNQALYCNRGAIARAQPSGWRLSCVLMAVGANGCHASEDDCTGWPSRFKGIEVGRHWQAIWQIVRVCDSNYACGGLLNRKRCASGWLVPSLWYQYMWLFLSFQHLF